MSGLNFLSLNKEESNPWIPPVIGRLISLSGTSDTKSLTTRKMPLENTMDRPWRNLYEDISNLRFRINIEDNPFQLLSGGHNPILPTFPM